jgi:hypothetical protein
MSRNKLGALSLALAGILFVLYPAVRPWQDETTVDGARRAMSADAWVAAHFFAMIGFILLVLALYAARDVVGSPAVVVTLIGAGLTLPYYGAEDFGLHAVAAKSGSTVDLLAVVQATRYNPISITMFGVGLLGIGVGAVLAAVAVWRSGALPRWSAVLLAVAFALFIPQFFAGEGVRIVHGVLVAVGCAWLAVALWRAVERVPVRLAA